jgi:hypothetical protein
MPKKMNPIDAHIRARNVARKLIETQGTMRSVAKELGVSAMTVYRDIHLLEEKDPSLFGVVKEHLDKNFAEKLSLLAGNLANDTTDCWASIAAPTALAPQIITIDLGQPKKIYSYTIINRFDTTNSSAIASPSSWSIEVRNNLLDDWIIIDNVQGDKDSNSLSVRKFSIAEEKRGEWRYFRIVIKDRNGTAPYTCISRLRIYGDLIGEELELVPDVTTKNDITVNGTSSDVIITKQKLSTLSNPYIITDEPSAVKLTIDSEREYEYSNNVKIALANTYIKFTATESGKYKFCYQEPAPVIT